MHFVKIDVQICSEQIELSRDTKLARDLITALISPFIIVSTGSNIIKQHHKTQSFFSPFLYF